MNDAQTEYIEIHQLQIGMFIELELGWMSHPFPTGRFKISSDKQISVIKGLGLKRVRYLPAKSDLGAEISLGDDLDSSSVETQSEEIESAPINPDIEVQRLERFNHDLLESQQRDLAECEHRFSNANNLYKLTINIVNSKPRAAMEQSLGMVSSFVSEMLEKGESAIRLLSDGTGDKAAMHPVNVTVLSLLLGNSMGLSEQDMLDLGMAAFLHDIGKTQLPDRVRRLEENFSLSEYKSYQQHVAEGVVLGQRMELTVGALQAITQHHELIDGSGFPARVKGASMSMPAKILALVNRYENLCNPSRPAAAITPHEALALIFAQLKNRYDGLALSSFIRMMGVYPPGSVVQLVDERFALVVSVNSSRPLKPRVIVHDPSVLRHEALILDLEKTAGVGIRRSLKPASMPKDSMAYLAPRQRISYFFETRIEPPLSEVTA